MKRTRKWAFVAQEAARLAALGLSPREIALKLQVNKSTVTRWIADGKLTRAPKPRAISTSLVVEPSQTPAQWAAAVRKDYSLDATDEQLVTLAEAALGLSLDAGVAPHVRMNASGRFQAIVRQLALVTRGAADVPAPVPTAPPAAGARKSAPVRRRGGDPRVLMMAIK